MKRVPREVPALVPLEVGQAHTRAVHNARMKRYPDGSAELLIGSQPFGGGSISKPRKEPDEPLPGQKDIPEDILREIEYARLERNSIQITEEERERNAADSQLQSLQRSVRRAKKVVQDLARSNSWTYFVTLTLDPQKVNRYDPAEVLKHLRHWLGNNVRRRGLRYVLVPEHHKDGAIHFHGLFNDALKAVDSGTMSVPGRKAPVKVRSEAHRKALERDGGHPVYNLPGWGWGFSTAIQLYGEMDAAINYVCKYIGKEIGTNVSRETLEPTGKIGGRWYYSGGDLQRPTVEWFDADLRDWEGYQGWFSPAALPGVRFLTLRVTAGGEVLDPYVAPSRGDAKHSEGEKSQAEEVSVPGTDGESRSGGQAPRSGDFDSPGASAGLSAETVAKLQACPNEEQYDAALWAALVTNREGTARDVGQSVRVAHSRDRTGHLTKSGLSPREEKPGMEGLEALPGQNDP